MLRAKKRKTSVGVFDLTPMIDVVLQLIIFFMFTSQFGQVSRTDVDLPNEPGEEERAEDKPTLIIDITLEGAYVIDARPPVRPRARDRRTRGRPLRRPVRDDGAHPPRQRAAASAINRLADEFARLGVRRWAIATRSEGGGG